MRFNQLVNSILSESSTPRVDIHDPKVIYVAVTTDGDWLDELSGYSEQEMMDELGEDVEAFYVSNFENAESIFLQGVYREEGTLTDSEEAIQNLHKRFNQLIEPYKNVHGQWFAGEVLLGIFVIGVKVDHNYYRTGGLQAIAGDDTTDDEGSIMSL